MNKTDIIHIWKQSGLETNDIEKILIQITGLSKGQLFLTDKIEDKYTKDIVKNFKRYTEWEPIEYIINQAEFYSLKFFVDQRVLIPRNDTEVMVDKALEEIANNQHNYSLIDVWTGSSCIPISILKNTQKIDFSYVIDISDSALEVSKINIEHHALEDNVYQIHWNLLETFLQTPELELSPHVIITANLPYIKNHDYENIDSQTIKHEPNIALFWWKETWFELYETLIHQAQDLKNLFSLSVICLFIEIWFDQKQYSQQYLTSLWLNIQYFTDNSWIQRCIKIEI